MFRSILVGVDGRRGGRDAIALAMRLAGPEARITLAHVYGGSWPAGRGAALALAAERLLRPAYARSSAGPRPICWSSARAVTGASDGS